MTFKFPGSTNSGPHRKTEVKAGESRREGHKVGVSERKTKNLCTSSKTNTRNVDGQGDGYCRSGLCRTS